MLRLSRARYIKIRLCGPITSVQQETKTQSSRSLKSATWSSSRPGSEISPASCLAMNSPSAASHPRISARVKPGILLMNDTHATVTPRIVIQNLASFVGRAVIHDDKLELYSLLATRCCSRSQEGVKHRCRRSSQRILRDSRSCPEPIQAAGDASHCTPSH